MKLIEIIIAIAVLFWLAYLPATMMLLIARNDSAGVKNGYWYMAVQVLLCLLIPSACVFLTELAPFNGMIDIGKLRVDPTDSTPLAFDVFSFAKYALSGFGVLCGGLTLLLARKLMKAGVPARIPVCLGIFSLLYGLAVPMLMQNVYNGILDSHLMH